jgi:hypothetical protein
LLTAKNRRKSGHEDGTRRAVAPFEFYTLAQVTRPENHSASTLGELLDALEKCSDESIFHHAVQAPEAMNAGRRRFE